MNTPDSKEFARQVLYHLSAIGAEVEENKLLLCDILAQIKSLPVEQVRNHYKEVTDERAGNLYKQSCAEAKLDPPTEEDLPDQAPEANPRG